MKSGWNWNLHVIIIIIFYFPTLFNVKWSWFIDSLFSCLFRIDFICSVNYKRLCLLYTVLQQVSHLSTLILALQHNSASSASKNQLATIPSILFLRLKSNFTERCLLQEHSPFSLYWRYLTKPQLNSASVVGNKNPSLAGC